MFAELTWLTKDEQALFEEYSTAVISNSESSLPSEVFQEGGHIVDSLIRGPLPTCPDLYSTLVYPLLSLIARLHVTEDDMLNMMGKYQRNNWMRVHRIVTESLSRHDCPSYVLAAAAAGPNRNYRRIASQHLNCTDEDKVVAVLLGIEQ